MQRMKFGLVFTVLSLFLAYGTPLHAQEQGVSLPPLYSPKSWRNEGVRTLNGQPVLVFQSEAESADRYHAVRHDLATVTAAGQALVAGRVQEIVVYDGYRYVRLNNETTWTKTAIPNYKPGRTLNEVFTNIFAVTGEHKGILSRLGPASVAGTPVTHYQYWITDRDFNVSEGGQEVEDYWLSSDGKMLMLGWSIHGSMLNLPDMEFSNYERRYDFDTPIVVGPPPADRIR